MTRWFERPFSRGLAAEELPAIIERLRTTPLRLAELTRGVSKERLTRQFDGTWSIQENVGHLLDLEPLWTGRLDDFLDGAATLRPTDLNNRKTAEANHNAQSLDSLVAAFRDARFAFVMRLETLSPSELELTALHPRLQQPMTVTDHCYFVAEHDDHHLTRITELLEKV